VGDAGHFGHINFSSWALSLVSLVLVLTRNEAAVQLSFRFWFSSLHVCVQGRHLLVAVGSYFSLA
jgi:hypothetical protein